MCSRVMSGARATHAPSFESGADRSSHVRLGYIKASGFAILSATNEPVPNKAKAIVDKGPRLAVISSAVDELLVVAKSRPSRRIGCALVLLALGLRLVTKLPRDEVTHLPV